MMNGAKTLDFVKKWPFRANLGPHEGISAFRLVRSTQNLNVNTVAMKFPSDNMLLICCTSFAVKSCLLRHFVSSFNRLGHENPKLFAFSCQYRSKSGLEAGF